VGSLDRPGHRALDSVIRVTKPTTYLGFTLSADEVVELPLDELALRVLYDADVTKAWNWRNWMLEAAQRGYQGRRDAVHALEEAWSYLITNGLVVGDTSQSSAESIRVSRRGHEVLAQGLTWLRAVKRLDVDLVPALEYTARPQFIRGDFETAAFVAMKEVEVQVRAAAGQSDSLVGTALMQLAFAPSGGPLWRADLDKGESVALMELFKGAIGLFKNPSSHRRVDLADPTEAVEIILLADLLLRLLLKIPAADAAPQVVAE